jgi:hypothetical protein
MYLFMLGVFVGAVIGTFALVLCFMTREGDYGISKEEANKTELDKGMV